MPWPCVGQRAAATMYDTNDSNDDFIFKLCYNIREWRLMTSSGNNFNKVLGAIRKADKRRIAVWGAYSTFNAVSLCTTAYGLSALIPADSSLIGLVVPLVISASVQAMIAASGQSFWSACRRKQWNAIVALTAILLICTLISVGFAFGWWHNHLRGGGVARDIMVAEVDQMIGQLQNSSYILDGVSTVIFDAAEYSRSRAEAESAEGRTCQSSVGKGDGPRAALRNTDNVRLGAYARRFASRDRSTKASLGELQEIRRTYTSKNHDNFVEQITQLWLGVYPSLTAVHQATRDWLQKRIERGRGEMKVPLNDEVFSCPDKVLEGFLLEAIDGLDQLQSARENMPAKPSFFRPDLASSLALAYQPLGGILGFSKDDGSPRLESADLIPLLLAATVDVVIFLTPWVFFGRNRGEEEGGDGGNGHNYITEINAIIDPDAPGSAAADDALIRFAYPGSAYYDRPASLYDLFERFTLETKWGDFVLVPLSKEPTDCEAAKRILGALNYRPYSLWHSVPRNMKLRLGYRSKVNKVTEVLVYRMRPGFLTELARESVRRQYSLAFFDTTPQRNECEAPVIREWQR